MFSNDRECFSKVQEHFQLIMKIGVGSWPPVLGISCRCTGELKFSGGVIHQLLLRELDHDEPTDEMLFLLGNHVVRFSKVEFSLITGLHFGVIPDTSMYVAVENGIHERYFPAHDEVSLDDLRVVLTQGEFEKAYDVVKLCLIYMLNWILIGVDERLKIPVWQFWLVEDLNAFDAFPWGAYVYRHSIFSFKHALSRCREERRQQSQGDVGHSIFAFEVIPKLAKVFETRRVTDLSPRLLKWELTKQPRGKKLEKIFSARMSARTEIMPTTAEAVAPYFAGLSEGGARMCMMIGLTFLLSLSRLQVQFVPRRRVRVGGVLRLRLQTLQELREALRKSEEDRQQQHRDLHEALRKSEEDGQQQHRDLLDLFRKSEEDRQQQHRELLAFIGGF
ncbi:hypothetical protein Ddye_005677 [Dipteronia dyeriana]|uniref:DUF1985 domain-containing protein n=1 Tax=Dipteronia dyeriana TaxID=168575 RepID=A0AAD9XGP9_9ROSI|nr:hypothetical protein Ddye_005677 [Dipteronia dyeriana]